MKIIAYHGSQDDNLILESKSIYLTDSKRIATDFALGYAFDYDLFPEDKPTVYTIEVNIDENRVKYLSTEEEYEAYMDMVNDFKSDDYDALICHIDGDDYTYYQILDAKRHCKIIDKVKLKTDKKGRPLTERLEELTTGIYATNSPYDVINFMKNKPKAYRIIYDSNINYYFIGDAFNYIHIDLLEEAYKWAFYPNMFAVDEMRDYMDDEMYNDTLLLFSFYPNEGKKLDIEKSSDGYTRKYVYDFGNIYAHEMTPLEHSDIYSILGKPLKREDIFESELSFKKLNKLIESYLYEDKLHEMAIHNSKLSFSDFYEFCLNKNKKKKDLSKIKDKNKHQQELIKIIKEDKYFKNISGKRYNNIWITENSIEHVKKDHPEIEVSTWESFLTTFNPQKDKEIPSIKLDDGSQRYIYKCTDGRNYYGYVIVKFPRATSQLITMFCDKEQNIDNWIKNQISKNERV